MKEEGNSAKSKRKNSSRRRRPATPQSPNSSSQTEESSAYFHNNHALNSGVSHRRVHSAISNSASQSYDEHSRWVNTGNLYNNNHLHGNDHKPLRRARRWFLRWQQQHHHHHQLPHSQSQQNHHSNANISGIQKTKKCSSKMYAKLILQGLLICFFIYTLAIYSLTSTAPNKNDRPDDEQDNNTNFNNQPRGHNAPRTHSEEISIHIGPNQSSKIISPDLGLKEKEKASEMSLQIQLLKDEADKIKNKRALHRQNRSRPLASSFHENTDFHSFHLNSVNDYNFENTQSSSPENLCGEIAKSTSLKHMNNDQEEEESSNPFPEQYALNKNSVVLISGILNPLGFHLAMALHHQCGVNRIIGMDPMLPNTVLYRMDLMKKLAILTNQINSLYQPVYVSLHGISPRRKSSKDPPEVDIVSKFNNPTHVVHLGGMEGTYSRDKVLGSGGGSSITYGTNRPMLELRESYISMEQILTSIKKAEKSKRPHLTYASTLNWGADTFGGAVQLGGELLASAYRKNFGVHSIGVRLGNIYGPWCSKKGSEFYKAMDRLVRGEMYSFSSSKKEKVVQWTYVQDAIDVVIAGMQYQPYGELDAILSSNGIERSTAQFLDEAEEILRGNEVSSEVNSKIEERRENELRIPPPTPMQKSLAKTLAWHLDDVLPFGPREKSTSDFIQAHEHSFETGNDFLNRIGQLKCSPGDSSCLYGLPTLPCASECVKERSSCSPSIFDDILTVSKKVTEGCDVVLYTSFLELANDEVLALETVSPSKQIKLNERVCNIALLSKYHYRVDELLSTKKNKKGTDHYNKYNGSFVEAGWNLIWVDDKKEVISQPELFLIKLSPGKLFSSSVKYAMFIDPRFQVTPRIDDVLFLVSAMHRKASPIRRAYLTDPNGERVKVYLPEEEEKRAVFLASPIKTPKVGSKPTKLSMHEATKFLKVEHGIEADSSDPKSLTQQREFYNRLPSYLDREDVRSFFEPRHKFEMNRWIRTSWIMHDMKRDEGKDLRCEWYQEHTLWGNELDQLSFAYIIAKKDLERKIGNRELDDHDKESIPPPEPWEGAILDTNDWIPVLGTKNGVRPYIEIIENNVPEEDATHDIVDIAKDENNVNIFVRIMSDHIMVAERDDWLKKRKLKKGK